MFGQLVKQKKSEDADVRLQGVVITQSGGFFFHYYLTFYGLGEKRISRFIIKEK